MSETSLASFLARSDSVGLLVMLTLCAMSAACWYQAIAKIWEDRSSRRRSAAFSERFRSIGSLSGLEKMLQRQPADEARGRLVAASLKACAQLAENGHKTAAGRPVLAIADSDEFIIRAMRRILAEEEAQRETGLTILASVGSCAPFVGLFGTVWGIYHALLGIGQGGPATLDRVAGPVGEALVMTAGGLLVAIPAVLLFNYLVRANRRAQDALDGFAHDLLIFLCNETHADQPLPFTTPRPQLRPEAA